MTRSRVLLRVALAAALVAVAAVLALLSVDVLRWSGQLERARVAYETGSNDPRIWQPSTTLRRGISRSLLDVDDEVAFGGALQRFRAVFATSELEASGDPTVFSSLERLELELDRLSKAAPTRRLRSQAHSLHAIALFRALQARGSHDLFARSTSALRRAVLLDERNDEAMYNLELVLRLFRIVNPLPIVLPEARAERGRRSGSRGGAGVAEEGSGF